MEEIVVKISGVTYSDRETGFSILKAIDSSNGRSTTVKGSFPGVSISIGLKAKFKGNWIVHEKFGRQFDAFQCEVIPEKGKAGIMNYLISHVPSIGPVTASKLYLEFGDELISVLDNEPDKLRNVSFLTKTQLQSILDEWKTASELRTIAITLSSLGLSSVQVKSVYKKWGTDTKEILKSDPYRLCECESVGFITADVAARRTGIEQDDPRRTKAVILAIMRDISQSDGHMYTTSSTIQKESRRFFKRNGLEPFSHGPYLSDSSFFQAVSEMQKDEIIVSYNNKLYLRQNWFNESESAIHVSRFVAAEPRKFEGLSETLEEFEKTKGLQLSTEQKEAYTLLGTSNIIVVSGFPGTGKTLLTSAFVHLFEQHHLDYTLMSPTGIAAKRASQVTNKAASTIHRSLGYKRDGTWEFNRSNKYHVDAVIIDEMSMVDTSTFYHLISALSSQTIIVFLGDPEQLPSVGSGNVLKNLMGSRVPHVSLTHIYRQEHQSDIIKVAHQILKGEPVNTDFNKESEFLFFRYPQDKVMEEIRKVTAVMKKNRSNFQVIAPMYDGDLGVNKLNHELRSVLNNEVTSGDPTKIKHGATDVYEGDRVMIIKNDYDRMIFNGDVGKVQKISIRDDAVEIKIFNWFDADSPIPKYIDKIFTFKIEEVKRNIRVAYACTAHKCQGQEFDYVLMPMTMKYGIMLYKNLVYTAITRAKKKVLIFGDHGSFEFAIGNDRDISRNSMLSDMIGLSMDKDEEFLSKTAETSINQVSPQPPPILA